MQLQAHSARLGAVGNINDCLVPIYIFARRRGSEEFRVFACLQHGSCGALSVVTDSPTAAGSVTTQRSRPGPGLAYFRHWWRHCLCVTTYASATLWGMPLPSHAALQDRYLHALRTRARWRALGQRAQPRLILQSTMVMAHGGTCDRYVMPQVMQSSSGTCRCSPRSPARNARPLMARGAAGSLVDGRRSL